MSSTLTYLALGDSYTIGEQVASSDCFPMQAVRLLREAGVQIADPKIIATTGWTTEELIGPMELELRGTESFSWVTLLIGVNNQYRGRDVQEYEVHFQYLAHRALHFAGMQANRVIVLSIPDWGLTPFNTERDRMATSAAIDAYNAVNMRVAKAMQLHYVEITTSTRAHANLPEYLAPDQLHPSALEYRVWADAVAKIILGS